MRITHRTRRSLLSASLAGLVPLLAFSGCSAPQSRSESSTSGPVKIGLILPLTGPGAAPAKDAENGWKLAWKQMGGRAAGRKVETVVTDEGACDPNAARAKAQQLIDASQVAVVVGPLCANTASVVAPFISSKRVVDLLPIASADDLTQRKPIKNVVRVGGWTSSQTTQPLGDWAYKKGYRTAVTVCTDYQFGHEQCGGFSNTFTDLGGKIVKTILTPLGTQDFSTYAGAIKSAGADVVFAAEAGSDGGRFLKAWNDFGLAKSSKLLGGDSLGDQTSVRALGSIATGLTSVGLVAEGASDPAVVRFVKSYKNAYGNLPSYYATNMYAAAKATAGAIEALDGDLHDPADLVKALSSVKTETPYGQISLDDHGNPVRDVFVRQLVERDGQLVNVPLARYRKVSQFWTYDPKTFLKTPVYSRSYQGIGVWPESR